MFPEGKIIYSGYGLFLIVVQFQWFARLSMGTTGRLTSNRRGKQKYPHTIRYRAATN
jgi:hypothetical protein